jgi:geranylgeranyl pyrophosphate synthase
VLAGARLGGADAPLLEHLRAFAGDVGVAFQIADDLLDQETGELCSLVRFLGPERARARAEELLDGALVLIEDLGERGEPLRELARYAVRRNR